MSQRTLKKRPKLLHQLRSSSTVDTSAVVSAGQKCGVSETKIAAWHAFQTHCNFYTLYKIQIVTRFYFTCNQFDSDQNQQKIQLLGSYHFPNERHICLIPYILLCFYFTDTFASFVYGIITLLNRYVKDSYITSRFK